MMKLAAVIENLSVAFFKHQVLRGVSASFSENSVSVLVGRSGSGKTTMLRALNRLNEEFPGCSTSGQVYIGAGAERCAVYSAQRHDAPQIPLLELRLRTGMLFQTPNLFPVSVLRNLTMPLQLVGGCNKGEARERAREALRVVGLLGELETRLDLPAERLSGGQQQRLCLARTLALRPRILLLDEPTASLDVHAARGIEDLLLSLADDYTIIMVSHSLAQARRMGEQILVCESGIISETLDSGSDISESLLERLL